MKNELTPLGVFAWQEATDTQLLAAQSKLWEFLGRRVCAYTMGDSSSVRVEMARELLHSVCYLLGIDGNGNGSALTAVLDTDLDSRFAEALKAVEGKIQTAQRLWQAACLSAPKIENLSLSSTLHSIGSFSKRYDYHYFAHEIPCDIDYQLCQPVAETLLGVDYILEYLRRILLEQDFLRRFSPALCTQVLNAYCPDYKGLLINLYQPVATNALGLALIQGDIHKLDISAAQREQMTALLMPLQENSRIRLLQAAASAVCDTLAIQQPQALRYLQELAKDLSPRLDAALAAGSLEGIFLSFSQ